MSLTSYSVALAKKQLSELLGRVAYGGETIIITKRGRPIAKLVSIDQPEQPMLGETRGWLEDDDPYFEELGRIVEERQRDTGRSRELGDSE